VICRHSPAPSSLDSVTHRERLIAAAQALERVAIAARLTREANDLLRACVRVGTEPVIATLNTTTLHADRSIELLRQLIARIPT
jgi:hypothetical protein